MCVLKRERAKDRQDQRTWKTTPKDPLPMSFSFVSWILTLSPISPCILRARVPSSQCPPSLACAVALPCTRGASAVCATQAGAREHLFLTIEGDERRREPRAQGQQTARPSWASKEATSEREIWRSQQRTLKKEPFATDLFGATSKSDSSWI